MRRNAPLNQFNFPVRGNILYYPLLPTVILTARILLLKSFAYIILIITFLCVPPRILLTTLDIQKH